MKYVYVDDWSQFKRIMDNLKEKIIYYKIDGVERRITLQLLYNEVLYIYRSKLDEFPYPCGIIEEPIEEIKKFGKEELVRNYVFGREITYKVGVQKIRGFNIWCVYSDFVKTIKEELNKTFSEDYILIEGTVKEK